MAKNEVSMQNATESTTLDSTLVGDEVGKLTATATPVNAKLVEAMIESCKTPATVVPRFHSGWNETVDESGDLLEEVDWEEELAGLSREALIATVRSLLSGVAEALPAEVEAARCATRDDVSAAFGKELLRLEEQYE